MKYSNTLLAVRDMERSLAFYKEFMESVAFREFAFGHSVEETAELVQHPLELVQQWFDNYIK